jgi:hypothetical protein
MEHRALCPGLDEETEPVGAEIFDGGKTAASFVLPTLLFHGDEQF